MNEFEEGLIRPLFSKLFNRPKGYAAAAMHGHAGWLVDGEQPFILIEGVCPEPAKPATALGGRRGYPNRRNSNLVTRFEPMGGTDPPAVHAHLTAAQDSVDVAARHAFQRFGQEIVDPLPLCRFIDLDPADRAFA